MTARTIAGWACQRAALGVLGCVVDVARSVAVGWAWARVYSS